MDQVKLKFLCSSYSTPLTQDQIQGEGRYRVYGASGLAGFLPESGCETDFLGIIKDGAGVGRINVYEAGSYLLGTMAYIVPHAGVNINWLKYAVMSLDLSKSISKTTIPHIYFSEYGNRKVSLCSFETQTRIAAFLDRKCAEIDTVIANTQQTLEEYRALRKAIITKAITKGVRGDRAMKNSGVEWIGQMPADWDLIPFRHVLRERQEKNSPIKSTERLSLSIELGVTLYADKTTNLDRFKDDFEQYKLAHPGDLVMNSMNMIVGASGVSDYFGCVSPVYYTFYDELEDHTTAKFCEYIFRSKTMLRFLFSLGKGIYAIVRGDDRVNTCRLKVSKEDLKSIAIPLPSVEEQREIISYLQKKCAEIDKLIADKIHLLEEMESYKKSVIYEDVTGKKEVPACQ